MRDRVAERIAVVLAGLVVALVLGEVGIRVARPIRSEVLLPLSYRFETQRQIATGDTYLRFDAALGWTLTPATTRRESGVLYRTNAAGLRADREYSVDPQPDMRRLAAFGDSFTHCYEVDHAACWAARLEANWPGTELLNFGVPGYGPDQAWLRYQSEGPAYRPCAVLIGYMVENINRVVNRFVPFYSPWSDLALSKPRFLLDGDGLTLLPNPATTPELLEDPRWVEEALGPHDDWYFPGTFVANPLDVFQLVRVARTAAYRRHAGERGVADTGINVTEAYSGEGEAFQVVGRVLVQFARQVREDGAAPVVVVFGRRPDIIRLHTGRTKAYRPLLDWLAREGIPTIDVTERLAEGTAPTDVNTLFTRGAHYNADGNRLVAAALADRLPSLVDATCRSG